jgi:hypothetical protein
LVAPPPPSPPPVACHDSSTSPSVRYGSKDLNPTVGFVNQGVISAQNLQVVAGQPATFRIIGGPSNLGPVFEICVKTNPPAANTHLGVLVSGQLVDPSPAGGPSGSVNFWQSIFATYFVNPLQDNTTDGQGILQLDVTAANLIGPLSNSPPGYSTGTERIKFQIGGGDRILEISLGKA